MSSTASRVRSYRARRAAGKTVLLVEVDEVGWAEVLVKAGLLSRDQADDPKALSSGTAKFIEILIADEQERGAL